jgi:hypothetical protein
MRRRRVLKLGALAAVGSGSLVGSGAFTSVQASRSVDVDVAPDADAYLGLEPTSSLARASTDGDDQLTFDIPGEDESTTGTGLSQNATYEFAGLFQVTNQGDDEVISWGSGPGSGPVESVAMTTAGAVRETKTNGVTLSPGDSVSAGLLVETGSGTGTAGTSLSIRAETAASDGFYTTTSG